jgi:phage-related tail fiber protein
MWHQLTGNAGLYHVARELSRRDWHVMLTVRNARGSDLYAVNEDERVVLSIQSKALSRKSPVPLGRKLETLRSDWWVITVGANTSTPTCYVMTLDEVKKAAHHGKSATSAESFWLQPKAYMRDDYREAWHRLDALRAPISNRG